MEAKKQSLNITLSSMRCWLYLNGDMTKPPIRAYADANCDVFIGEFTATHNPQGEEWRKKEYIEYSSLHVVKLRDGLDGFVDKKWYKDRRNKKGEMITKPGNSPFLNNKNSNAQRTNNQ